MLSGIARSTRCIENREIEFEGIHFLVKSTNCKFGPDDLLQFECTNKLDTLQCLHVINVPNISCATYICIIYDMF